MKSYKLIATEFTTKEVVKKYQNNEELKQHLYSGGTIFILKLRWEIT